MKESLKLDVIILRIFLSESAESLKQLLWAKKPSSISHFQKFCEEQKRRWRKHPAKFLCCSFKPGETSPASILQMLCGGSDGTSLSCTSPHWNVFIHIPTFISCWFHLSKGRVSHRILYFTTSRGVCEQHKLSGWAGVAGKVWTGMTGWRQGCGNGGKKTRCSLGFGQCLCSTSRWKIWACAIWLLARY